MEGYRGLGQTASLYPVPQQAFVQQPEPAPYEFNTPTGLGQTQIARGITSAYGGAKAGLQGYGASIADAIGARQLAQEWYANAKANAEQAELNGPRVRTLGAIQNPDDALDYGLGKVGEFAPYLVAGGGLGLLGRGAGALAGLRGAELARAGHMTAAAGFQPLMAGEQALSMHNDPAAQGMSPQEVLARSQGVGAAQAYVGAAVPSMMGGQLTTRTAAPTIGRTVGQALSNSVAGGAGMAGMDVIGQMHKSNYDPSHQYNPVDTGEAFAGGVAGMLPISGVHGAITHGLDKGVQLPDKALEATKTEAQRVYEAAKRKAGDMIDVVPDGVKDRFKAAAKWVAEKDQDAGAYYDEHLAKEFEAAGIVGGVYKDVFLEAAKQAKADFTAGDIKNIIDVENAVDHHGNQLSATLKVAAQTLQQIVPGDTTAGKLLGKLTGKARSKEARFEAIADAMLDPGEWFDGNLTADQLKTHRDTLLKDRQVQDAFLDDIVGMLNDHGQETEAANQIREFQKQVKSGTPLDEKQAAAMYITAKLAADAQGTERGIVGATKVFENTRAAQDRTGKTIPGTGEVASVQYAKSGESFHENSLQAALSVAGTSPELAKDIARRVQLLDILGDGSRKGRGADIVVREAVTRAFEKHGITPGANRAFTEMYDKVLTAVNDRLTKLREDGSIPKEQTAEEIGAASEAFKGRVREHVDEMLDSTDAGKQLKGSPKIAESVANFVGKLALGHPEYTQRAATRMFTQILARFGDAGRTAIDKIIGTADDAYGGESRAAGRVGMLRENVDNIYDVAVAIGNTVKSNGQVEHASGNKVPNYKLIGELLEDLDLTKRVDSKREALIAHLREAKSKRNKLMDFDKREKAGEHIKDVEDTLLNHGLKGLAQRWLSEGVVDAKKFNSLVGLLEKYDRHGDRLDRPERKPGDHVKSAGRAVEEISHEDPEYLQAEQENAGGDDGEKPITAEALGGRTGDERTEFIEKRRLEKYGTQGEEKRPARFVGSEIFDSKTYDAKNPTLGAPVTRHPSGDRGTSYNSERSEYTAMAEEAHTVYGHALTDARAVRMAAWAEEMSNTQGGTPAEHLNNAMEALLKHDQRRAASGKLTTKDAEFIEHRAEMAERLKDADVKTAGEQFFASKMNRNYRYYRVEQGNNENLTFSADQLKHGYAVPEGMTAEQYAANEAKKRGPFAPKVYEDSLMPVEFSDGTTRLIDIAKLVHDTVRRHQIADTAGVGDKRITPDKGQQILDAFHSVMSTLMTTDGVKRVVDSAEGGKMFSSEDAPRDSDGSPKKFGQKEDFSQHFDPSLVIFREAVPHKTQVPGEAPEDVAVKNFFTMGQLSQIAGMDALGKTKRQGVNKMTLPVTDRVPGQQPVGPGVFRKQDMVRIMTKGEKVSANGLAGQNGKAEPVRAKKAREDANKQGVAINGLTRVVKEKSVDKDGSLVKPFVGDNVAYSVDVHALLVRMLERNNMDPHEALVEGNLPIDTAGMLLREAFQEMKTMGYDGALFNQSSELFDGLVVFTRYEFEKNNPVTLGDLKKRGVFDTEREKPITTPRNLEDAKLAEVFSTIDRAEKADADSKEALASGSRNLEHTSPLAIERRAKAIEEAWSRTEWGLWRDPEREKEWDYSDAALALGRLVDHLGGTKDIPLQDKAEAIGGERRVTYGTEVSEKGLVPWDHAIKIYDRLKGMFSGDPAMLKFMRDTFYLDDKGFEKWLEKRAAAPVPAGEAMRRTVENARTTTGKSYAEVLPKAPISGKVAQGRANIRAVEEAESMGREGRLKPGGEPQRASKANETGLGAEPGPTMNRADTREAAYRARADLEDAARAERRAAAKAKQEPVEPAAPVATPAAPKVDIGAVIKDFSSREPKSPAEAQRLVKTLSNEQLQEFALGLPSLKDAKGTAAEQAVRLLSSQSGITAEWAQAQRDRAGVSFNGSKFEKAATLGDTPFSKEQRGAGREVSQQEADAIAKKLLGDIIPVNLVDSLGVDSDGLKIVGRFVNKSIELARSASSWEVGSDGSVVPTGGGSRGTLHHEVWHAVEGMLKEMGPHGEKILADIYKHMDTPLMKNWLKEAYSDAGVDSQLDSMSERAAFVFQKLSEGIKMPMVKESKTILQHLGDFVKWVGSKVGFNTTTAKERSDNFMDYVMKGDFARDMDNAASVRKGLGEKNGDNIVHQAGQILKPGLEALSAVFQHTGTRVADLKIPEYDTVMNLMAGAEGKGGYINDKRRMEYSFDNEIGNLIKGMPEEQMQTFRSKDPRFKEFQGKIEKYMGDAGVEPHQVMSFYKRLATLNADEIGKNMEAFITDLVQHGDFRGKAGEARTLANQIADRGFYYNKDRDLFPNRPDLKDKWAERDFGQAMARYIQQAVHLAERTRERDGVDGKKYRMNDLKGLLEAGNAKADSNGQKLMADTIAAYEGTLGADKLSPGLRKFMGSLLFINNVRLLPKAVFSQMLEPMQLALRKGSMTGTLDTLWRGIREMPRSFDKLDAGYTPDKWEKLAGQIGTAPSRIIANVMAQMQNGMTLPGKIGHWNDQFFKLNFMDQWNRSMHIEATKHGAEFLKEHAAIVRTSKDPAMVKRSQRYLNELGLKESDIKVDGEGGLFINFKDVGSDRVARALSQYVNEAMAHPDAGSNPMWMNDPRFALLAQMKRFTFAHSKYVLDRGIKEYKLGNAFPLVPAVLAMPWMLAADGLRDTITMTDTSYKNNWGIMDYAEHAWARSGNAGRGQFFGDVEQSVRHGGSGFEGAAGPTAELFGRFARGMHTGQWFDSMVNQVPGAPMIMPD